MAAMTSDVVLASKGVGPRAFLTWYSLRNAFVPIVVSHDISVNIAGLLLRSVQLQMRLNPGRQNDLKGLALPLRALTPHNNGNRWYGRPSLSAYSRQSGKQIV
jgi:hypothetical protein